MTDFPIHELIRARQSYLETYTTNPEQFNIRFTKDEQWKCEFHPDVSCWSEGFVTWFSGDEVLTLFESAGAITEAIDNLNKSIMISWDNDFND